MSTFNWDETLVGHENWTTDSHDFTPTDPEPRTFDRGYKA